MEQFSNRAFLKWSNSQIEHFSNGAILKWSNSQIEHFSNGAILKWSNSQREQFSNAAFWGRHPMPYFKIPRTEKYGMRCASPEAFCQADEPVLTESLFKKTGINQASLPVDLILNASHHGVSVPESLVRVHCNSEVSRQSFC